MLKTNLYISKVTTLADGSVRLYVDTPELTPEAMAEIFLLKKSGECAAILQASPLDTKIVEATDLPIDGDKTPSQRLRGVLFRLWESENKPLKTFALYYDSKMEQIIEAIKSKLND